MIRPLRQRHRHVFIALGIILPLAFAVGIAARKPMPGMDALPDALAATPQKFPLVSWERADLFTKSPMPVRLLRENTGAVRFAVAFCAPKNFVRPDLLVYWVAGNPSINETLPEQAQLLGAFDSVALPLPDESAGTSGVLVLYSLADGNIVDVSRPARFNDSMK